MVFCTLSLIAHRGFVRRRDDSEPPRRRAGAERQAGPRVPPQPAPFCEFDSPSSSSRTSASRNRRCPPGVRMLLIRPDAAHRVTVFGSTLNSAATSPGVSRRSLLPSISPTPWVRGLSPSVAETSELSHKLQLYPSIRKIPYGAVDSAGPRTTAGGRRGARHGPGAVL